MRLEGEAPWSILSPVEQRVMDKMQAAGTPLAEWDVNSQLRHQDRLTTTPSSSTTQTRRALIAKDSNSAEIIKPVLRGRDIPALPSGSGPVLWLIDTHNSASQRRTCHRKSFLRLYRHLLQSEDQA